MAINIKRLISTKMTFCGCIFFIFINISSAIAANNPFETNPSLRGYAKEALQAVQSKEPAYLQVAQTNEKEMEDIYQYLRDQIDKPLDIWKLVLLDYPRLRLLRNEIYARHGRVFTSEDLDSYFRSSTWYKPNAEYTDSSLSEIELTNLSALKRIEYLKFNRNEDFFEKAEGKVHFSSNSSEDGDDGRDSLIPLCPLWGKNVLVSNPVEENEKERSYGRIVISDENGKKIINVKINSDKDSLLMNGGGRQELTKLVLIAPDLLYAFSKDSDEQNLVFLKKPLAFNPQVGKMYAYRPAIASSNGIDCQKQKRAELITPIYNPAVLWENEFPSEIEPIITPKCIILTFSTNKETSPKETTYIEGESYESYKSRETKSYQSDINAASLILAFDKLTGRLIWKYRVPAKVQAIEYKDNLVAVKYYSGLTLVQIDSGKPLWDIKTTNSLVEFPTNYNRNYEFQLFIGEKKILVGYYGILGRSPGEPAEPAAVPGAPVKLVETINYYDIETGKFIESKDLLKLSKLFSNGKWEYHLRWFSSADKIFIPLKHTQLNNGNLSNNSNLVAIDFDGNLCWIFETPAEIQQYTTGNPAPACLKYSMNNCYVNIRDSQCCCGYIDAYKISKFSINLDPATGKQVDTESFQQVPVPIFWSTHLLAEHKKQRNEEAVKPKDLEKTETEAAIKKIVKPPSQMGAKVEAPAPAAAPRDYICPGSCVPTVLSDGLVYAMDRYNHSTVELYDACLTKLEGEGHRRKNIFKRKHYWTFPSNGGVYFIDHNFIVVKRGNNYKAIGEKALKDYIMRKDGQIYVNIQKEMQAEQQQSNAIKGKKNKKY